MREGVSDVPCGRRGDGGWEEKGMTGECEILSPSSTSAHRLGGLCRARELLGEVAGGAGGLGTKGKGGGSGGKCR